MKKLILLFFIAFVIQAATCQNYFSQQLVGSGGGQTDNATYQTSWSVGEPITATAYAGSYALTQGFQQGPFVSNPIWTGTLSTNWNTPGNWLGNIVPEPDDDVTIPVGCPHYPLLSSGTLITCMNLQVAGSFEIGAGGALTVNGALVINGSFLVSNQGSLITNGSVSGIATVQRYINNDLAWHFLSSPVSGQPICNGVFAPIFPGSFPGNINTWDFYNWLPGECDADLHWRNLRKSNGTPNNVDFPLLAFQDSRGYLVAYGDTWGTTKSFVGTPNTADRSLAFYDAITECSWALPGNPFPSAVAWSGVTLKENLVYPYYYIWNDVTQNYEWWGDATHHAGVKINGNIPSMQGFFVKIDPTKGLHLNIPNSARVHDNAADTWIKESVANKLSLKIENGTSFNDIAYVMYENNCNAGQDRLDAEKMFSMNTKDVPQVYTIINNDLKACSNSQPYFTKGTTIPIGFVAPGTGNYTITAGNLESFNLSELTGLTLEDLQLNVSQNLLQNPVYHFTSAGKEDAGRFLLHFGGAISVSEMDNNPISIYANEKTVFINNAPNSQVTISNLLGQEILTRKLSNQSKNLVKVNSITGYYIVKVQGVSFVKIAKVYIN